MAVCAATSLSPASIAAGLAIDNVVGLLYFPLVSVLAGPAVALPVAAASPGGALPSTDAAAVAIPAPAGAAPEPLVPATSSARPSVQDYADVLAVAFGLTWLAERVTGPANALPVATLLAVAAATALPAWAGRLAPAGEDVAKLALFVYFAGAGASGGSIAASASYLALLPFLLILYVVHLSVVW